MNYAADNTFTVSGEKGTAQRALQRISKEWRTDQRERFDRTVKELNATAQNLCSAYDKLVRAARKKLAT